MCETKSMCGRFSQIKAQQDLEHYYGKSLGHPYRPNYNVAPTQTVPVVTAQGFEDMRWGLVPQWAESDRVGYSMMNARAETLTERRTYKQPFLSGQRCLVPATSFYEWQGKTPLVIHLKQRELFSLAGLFVTRHVGESELKTFTIITTEPNAVMKPIHDRMPVILDRKEEQEWLSHEDPLDLLPMLDPYSDSDMEAYEVAKEVGNIKNNYPELLTPVK